VLLKTNDSASTYSAASFSVGGIGWIKILFRKDFSADLLESAVIDAEKIVINFGKLQQELRFGAIHLSAADSSITADSIRYSPLIDDERYFAKSQFRQTRYRLNIPKFEIMGADYPELLKGKAYKARKINISNISADILVNMDKPYNTNSPNPQMPNELLSSMKEIIKIDSVKIIHGQLKYSERFAVRGRPGVITLNKVNISASGLANHTATTDAAVINAEAVFMNSGKMKLLMVFPLASKDFSLRYSGSLSGMEAARLNEFLEPGEHHRIKSGVLQSATFKINVNSGYARGTLRVAYKDLTIAILDKDTGSENGIFNRISSFFGRVFVIRGTNMPDEKGLMKIGEVEYRRNSQDYFFQMLWFALRSGLSDAVGFPKEPVSVKK
jgi:hypothetical protein